MNKKKALVFFALIPFLMVLVQPAYAEIEKGKNFDQELIAFDIATGKKTYSWSSAPERVLDDSNQWQDFIFTNHPNYLQVETGHGSVRLDKTTCGFNFYDKGRVNSAPLFTDSIIARQAVNGTDNWTAVSSVNNEVCQASWDGTSLQAKKTKPGVGTLYYRYKNADTKWKTELEVINLSALTNRKFAFTQTIDLNSDHVRFGDTLRNINNFNNTTFDRAWIEQHKSKVLDLLDKFNFDLDLAYDNLWAITVYDTGQQKSKIAFDYSRNSSVLLPNQSRLYDPTYNQLASSQGRVYSSGAGSNCASLTGDTADTTLQVHKQNIGTGCQMVWQEWDISSIGSGNLVSSAYFEWDQTGTTAVIENCSLYAYATRPSTLTTAQKWSQGWGGQGAGSGACNANANNVQINFNSTGIANLQSNISGSEGWWGNMFQFVGPIADGTARTFTMTATQTRLNIVYDLNPKPNAVTTLVATATGPTSADLDWTQPSLNAGSLVSYRINYTTPFGAPTTILVNNSGTGVSYSVSGLTQYGNYSFRIGVQTTTGNNQAGNISNVTLGFVPANFTIGNLNFNSQNPNIFPIRFERTDVNSTYTTLKVIYDEDYRMNCAFNYQFAMQTDTYYNITESVYSTSENYTNFNFRNHNNDIINARCWDNSSNDTGRYTITQTSFPLLEQIANFRNGTYGTMGMIGAIDFITLAIILFSTVGFSRVNETMAAIINIALLGALWYFDIVVLPTLFLGIIAVVIVVIIGSTRRD